MDRRRIFRQLAYLTSDAGCVVAGVIDEIGRIPVDRQNPVLVAEALASARVVADPESAAVASAAFARLVSRLEALHEVSDDDD
jgi:hypothetical protein